MYYIGIDLGTSSVKGIMTDSSGAVLRETSADYDVLYPHDGWSEQHPEDWLKATEQVLKKLSDGVAEKIGGISVGGQMHGLVILDKDDKVIRPCILWNDGRTEKQTRYLNGQIGEEKLCRLTANIAYAGFTAPKLLWIKENEPENFARIDKIMLPKDYLVYMLTGKHVTDYSDASGTLLLDVEHKRWSDEMCELCGVDKRMLPELKESYEKVGKVLGKYSLENAVVAAGAGDNAAAAVGMGVVRDGDCNISLGTSGTVFIARDKFTPVNGTLHSFAHADGKWHLMGCILSAASANKWWLEDILGTDDYSGAVKGAEKVLGENDVFFLPYLMGERSPHNDVRARGAFIGMRPDTDRSRMCLAVLEGVAFALRDCVEIARSGGAVIKRTNICGGGAKSELWKKIIANVLDVDVYCAKTEKGPALGGALFAMVANGKYKDIVEAADKTVKSYLAVRPEKALVEKYDERYAVFKKLYPALKPCFGII